MAKTAIEIKADADSIIADLKRQRDREREVYKAGRIGNKAFQEFSHIIDRMIQNTLNECDNALKQIKIATLPDPSNAINEKMKADHERRRLQKFMEAAGPALESALNLEEAE